MTVPLLSVRGLTIAFGEAASVRRVVDDLDFDLPAGRTLAVVGESGSGKTQTGLALIGLTSRRARLTGSIRFEGRECLGGGEADWRALRGARIGMVFQDPMTALNPYLRIGDQLVEVLRSHRRCGHAAAQAEVVRMLDAVRIPAAPTRLRAYPHEFSGGMRQRVLIAMALLARPTLLIADEPTTALDVTVQAQILRLLQDLQRDLGMALLLITHDLGVVGDVADQVLVMYAGRAMESGPAASVLRTPRHPYTRALLRARPSLRGERAALLPIPGAPPRAIAEPGCVFAPRCASAAARCRRATPTWAAKGDRGWACLLEVDRQQ
jgi:oligopeptide transport system ATP-binding protein